MQFRYGRGHKQKLMVAEAVTTFGNYTSTIGWRLRNGASAILTNFAVLGQEWQACVCAQLIFGGKTLAILQDETGSVLNAGEDIAMMYSESHGRTQPLSPYSSSGSRFGLAEIGRVSRSSTGTRCLGAQWCVKLCNAQRSGTLVYWPGPTPYVPFGESVLSKQILEGKSRIDNQEGVWLRDNREANEVLVFTPSGVVWGPLVQAPE